MNHSLILKNGTRLDGLIIDAPEHLEEVFERKAIKVEAQIKGDDRLLILPTSEIQSIIIDLPASDTEIVTPTRIVRV